MIYDSDGTEHKPSRYDYLLEVIDDELFKGLPPRCEDIAEDREVGVCKQISQ